MGEYQKSQDHYCKAIHLRELSKLFPSTVNFSKIAVARTKVISNEKDIDLESLCSYANENKIKLYDGSTARHISDILMNIDEHHMTEAKDWINKAIKAHKRYGMMWDLGRDYALYGELSKRMGDQSKAKENLNKAKDIFKECGADGWAQQTERSLSQL